MPLGPANPHEANVITRLDRGIPLTTLRFQFIHTSNHSQGDCPISLRESGNDVFWYGLFWRWQWRIPVLLLNTKLGVGSANGEQLQLRHSIYCHAMTCSFQQLTGKLYCIRYTINYMYISIQILKK